jgi:hypothetical protein
MLPSGNGSTPPHHPTYNVHFSAATIREIVSAACPAQSLLSFEPLPSGKSFNNRIYFLEVENNDAEAQKQSLVLKVSGQFFGPDKVQNEVSCLMLLDKHCPNVPVPRVIAWSEDGFTIRCSGRLDSPQMSKLTSVHDSSLPAVAADTGGRGWVLMTRRPGRLLRVEDLEGPHCANLMRELATYMAQWRGKLPRADRIGNMKHVKDVSRVQQDGIYESFEDDSLKVTIAGLLYCHYVPPEPITSPFDYYCVRLKDQLTKLETEDVFAAMRKEVSPVVREFTEKTLRRLSLFSSDQPAAMTFTHYDFSPRNILVSENSPPLITGILDFEFAGFFPDEEEFTNNAIANRDDWPAAAYKVFLEELEKLGEKTPLRGIDQESWKEACRLVQITEDVAPWYLREGGTKGPELVAELSKASDRIKFRIAEFEAEAFRKRRNNERERTGRNEGKTL